jgi:HAD superfamily hydrolase (TIGR01509 family)
LDVVVTRIAAVVFDFDGLLVDSEPLQEWAWATYVERFGATLTAPVLHDMLGRRSVDSAQIIVERLQLPVTPAVALRERDELFLASVPGRVLAMTGAVDLVHDLRARTIPIALATSGHRRYIDLALASAGLAGCFDVEVTGDQVQHGKPHPDIYLRAAEALGVQPAACLALEDVPNGIRSAKAAGMLCFAVPGTQDSPHDLSDADAVLPSLADVLPEFARRGIGLGER